MRLEADSVPGAVMAIVRLLRFVARAEPQLSREYTHRVHPRVAATGTFSVTLARPSSIGLCRGKTLNFSDALHLNVAQSASEQD